MKLHIGTSAFNEKQWKGTFYPERLPDKEMLRYYAERLTAVEINNTFYRAPTAALLESWLTQVPESFRFALKAPQAITHFKRLKNAEEDTEYLFRTARVLGDRLGPIFFQLPPNLKKDMPRLESFLGLLPGDIPVAFEFRHDSWLEDDSVTFLRSRGCSLCIVDTDERDAQMVKTADWGYLRLRKADYSDQDLIAWLARIREQGWASAFVFFKHEESATGPKRAQRLIELAG